jgi:hypothetical protein
LHSPLQVEQRIDWPSKLVKKSLWTQRKAFEDKPIACNKLSNVLMPRHATACHTQRIAAAQWCPCGSQFVLVNFVIAVARGGGGRPSTAVVVLDLRASGPWHSRPLKVRGRHAGQRCLARHWWLWGRPEIRRHLGNRT